MEKTGEQSPQSKVMGSEGPLVAPNVGYEREVDLEEAMHPRRWCLCRDLSLLSCRTAVFIGTADIFSELWDFCSIFQVGVGCLTQPKTTSWAILVVYGGSGEVWKLRRPPVEEHYRAQSDCLMCSSLKHVSEEVSDMGMSWVSGISAMDL